MNLHVILLIRFDVAIDRNHIRARAMPLSFLAHSLHTHTQTYTPTLFSFSCSSRCDAKMQNVYAVCSAATKFSSSWIIVSIFFRLVFVAVVFCRFLSAATARIAQTKIYFWTEKHDKSVRERSEKQVELHARHASQPANTVIRIYPREADVAGHRFIFNFITFVHDEKWNDKCASVLQ